MHSCWFMRAHALIHPPTPREFSLSFVQKWQGWRKMLDFSQDRKREKKEKRNRIGGREENILASWWGKRFGCVGLRQSKKYGMLIKNEKKQKKIWRQEILKVFDSGDDATQPGRLLSIPMKFWKLWFVYGEDSVYIIFKSRVMLLFRFQDMGVFWVWCCLRWWSLYSYWHVGQ